MVANRALAVFPGENLLKGRKREIRPANILCFFVFLSRLSHAKFPLTPIGWRAALIDRLNINQYSFPT